MFGKHSDNNQTKQATGSVGSRESGHRLDLNQQDQSFTLQDIPIHTMKDDLKNPNADPSADISMGNSYFPKTYSNQNQKPAESPFLGPPKDEKIIIKEKDIPGSIKPKKKGSKIIVFIFIFTILIAGAGGYYYWISQKNTVSSPSLENVVNNNTGSAPQDKMPAFSTTSANYMSIDIANSDKVGIDSTIQEYVKKVSDANLSTPTEFIITDKNNNPINFKDFAAKLGIGLSPGVTNTLADKFSLFIYSDAGKMRLGVAIQIVSITDNKSAMTQEEKNLPKELEPLYLTKTYKIEEKVFSTGNYKNFDIRYSNITSPEDLSVDYTQRKGYLLIGTTKMTLRSIIDYLEKSGQ